MGIAPGGIVSCLLKVVHGALNLAPALEVEGELGRNVLGLDAKAGIQADRNTPVQLLPPRTPKLLVQHLSV